ncbi:DUF1634 domain-containing protein [Edaphobacter sp. HDX4]|uniref:DUF1634 domain-containing protein n=1 Tax=Edaphobacter sp. HDX4 TaxID=2794064 RepID=UPI002FE63B73
MTNIGMTGTKLQRIIGLTLRSGVIAASATGILGGVLFLATHGGQLVSFHVFEGTQSPYSSPAKIVQAALKSHSGDRPLRGLAIAQLGIMMLLLTPIIRVAFSIVGFAIERDRIYVVITSIVLATLIASLLLR